jgi:multidrug efflux pump subunit AcrA (membrane-fusion protein)
MKKILFPALLPAFLFFSCKEEKENTHPVYMPLTEAVYASGKIKSFNEYKVYASVQGILKSRLVTEGDTVSAGQVIAEIQSDVSGLRENNSQILLEYAHKNASADSPILSELSIHMESARIRMENDSTNFTRFSNLLKQGIGTKADVETKELIYKTSLNNYTAAKKRYLNMREQLETEYRNALTQKQISSSTRNDFRIRSLINGRIYALYKEQGEMVSPQEPIALIGDARRFMIELAVDELDINKIKTGQTLLITMDTYGEKFFKASVKKIYPLMDQKTQTFTVEAEFLEVPRNLYPGLTAEANIVISQNRRAMVIPSAFLFPGDSIILKDGKKQKVKTGLKNLEYAEILSGADTTTVIYKQ